MNAVADRVYLHIGAPKSGTTYLQTILWANQDALRDSGVLLPGIRRLDHGIAAVWARTARPTASQQHTWERVRSAIGAWTGPAIVSNEWFTRVPADLVERLLDDLQPAEVHIIFTARNLLGTVPAAWQERLKLGDVVPLDDFLATMDTHHNWSWQTLDASTVLPIWEPFVPADRIHVVTVPPRGAPRDLLWKRFAAACDLNPSVCDLNAGFANESLSAEGARLLQLLGPQLRAAVDADTARGMVPHRWIRDYFSHTLLAARPGRPIALLEAERTIINDRSEALVDTLGSSRYRLHGDLSDLIDGEVPDTAIRPEDLPVEVVLDEALAVIPPMLGRLRTEQSKAERLQKRVDAMSAELAGLRHETRPADSGPPVIERRPLRKHLFGRVPNALSHGLVGRLTRAVRRHTRLGRRPSTNRR